MSNLRTLVQPEENCSRRQCRAHTDKTSNLKQTINIESKILVHIQTTAAPMPEDHAEDLPAREGMDREERSETFFTDVESLSILTQSDHPHTDVSTETHHFD